MGRPPPVAASGVAEPNGTSPPPVARTSASTDAAAAIAEKMKYKVIHNF
jgi:hypothetical protein